MKPEMFIGPREAADRLGISPKALRVYEQRGLITPLRSEAGWRTYGPEQMARAFEIVALRALGLSLSQVGGVLNGDPSDLEAALGEHQSSLEAQLVELTTTLQAVCTQRAALRSGGRPPTAQLSDILPAAGISVSFPLPWPWDGEHFVANNIQRLNYLVGPLGCGKTRLAMKLADELPNARFVGLDRSIDDSQMTNDNLGSQLTAATDWIVGEGGVKSDALCQLLAGLFCTQSDFVVIDLIEQGLDEPTQQALMSYLRSRADLPSLFMITRSSTILDLAMLDAAEAIFLCPANHNPPIQVAPYPGSPGYEVVQSCLATPLVSARTEGVIAWRRRTPPREAPVPESRAHR